MLNKLSSHLVILVATYNRLESLKRTIHSISSGTHCSHEIIVIDGGSNDGTIEFLRSCSDITPVFQGRLLGQARACNEVWREIDSKYTCWLSDDTELVPGRLDLAVTILAKKPTTGMVGLKMKDTVGRGAQKDYGGALSTFGIVTCNHGVLPLNLLREVGYFNEDYKTYGIDPDLTASVLCAGKNVLLTKKVSVLHHRVVGNVEKRRRELDASKEIYLRKFRFLKNSSYLSSGWRRKIRELLWERMLSGLFAGSLRLGLTPRDQVNLLKGRFIHCLDPFLNLRNPYYLSQRIPEKLLLTESNPYRHLVGKRSG